MNRINFLPLVIVVILLTSLNAASGQTGQKRLNIVLIVSDDHGTDAYGAYGNPVIKTPNLDNLAQEGTRFTSAFCTSASCSPSRSVILTGKHNHANGMYGLEHSYHHFESFENIKGLPNKLSESGYRTARIGKYHVAPEEVYKFEEVLSIGTANDPASIGRSPVEMANLCTDFITQNSSRPFFLYYATDDPHRSNLYIDGKITFESYPDPNLFGNREEGYPGVKEVTYTNAEVIVPSYLPDNKATRSELAQYYQSTSRLDQGVGRLIEILKETGQYENTLIIYISDNGPAFPAAKTTLYEPGVRLPCVVKAPNHSRKGFVQDAMISWTDLTPTILEYAQAAADPEEFNGHSFKALVENDDIRGWNEEIYGSHSLHEITMYYPMRMVRNKNYKLIYNIAHQLPFPFALDLHQAPSWISVKDSEYFGKRKKENLIHRPRYELYDMKNDPDELNNLAGDERYQSVLEEMIQKIREFQESTNDPWVHKWGYE